MSTTEKLNPTLYKYREFDNEYHLRFLTEGEVYFAPPIEFDDPKDCAITVRVGSDPREEFVTALKGNLTSKHPQVSPEEVEQSLNQFVSDGGRISESRSRELISEMVGVLSLSRNPGSSRMWRDYAQNHTGFCVGLDSEKLNQWCLERSKGEATFRPLPVEYSRARPSYSLSVDRAVDVAETAVTIKRVGFYWEQEYRVIGYYAPGKVMNLPDEIFDSIGVGKGASRENLRTVEEIANGLNTDVRIFKGVSIVANEVRFREVGTV